MELIIIGSGTGVPAAGRAGPGSLVRMAGRAVAFDLGPGSVHRWANAGVLSREVGEVFLTHLHPDHTADLVILLFAFRNPLYRREAPLRLVGPEGLTAFHHGLLRLYGDHVAAEGFPLEIVESVGGLFPREGWSVRAERVAHTAGSLGYRVEADGRTLVISGDTGDCEGIRSLGRGADVLLLECSVPEEAAVEGHLTPSSAGRIAADCGVGRLVLNHLYPRLQGLDAAARAAAEFGGEVIVAEDGMTIPV